MKLYHLTSKQNWAAIQKTGLQPNRMGIVYLTPIVPDDLTDFCGGHNLHGDPFEVALEIETGDLRLTAFEDCSDWEVLCWGNILPENIKLMSRI